jgi:sulfonate transport system substrate-binding protein
MKLLLAAMLFLLSASPSAAETIRIGYQKYSNLLLVKERGLLAETLRRQGITIEWTEFPGGPSLLEALNIGAIDFGTAGDAPPIFALAAGAPLVYVAYEATASTAEAILVPKDSPITSLTQLKGKKIAFNKGSNVHYLLVRALESVGLSIKDIEPVYLAPADGRAAFERGAVDAWVIWDPYYAAGQAATGAHVLTDGHGLVPNRQFFLAGRAFATTHRQAIAALRDSLADVDAWARGHTDEIAAQMAPKLGIPASILKTATARLGFGVKPIDAEALAEQQRVADSFYALGLIPKPLTISDATLKEPS